MTFKKIFQKTYRESRGANPLTFVFCLLAQVYMQSLKTHSKAFLILKNLQFFKQRIAEFYFAEIFYFYGDFTRSLKYLDCFLKSNPNHADAIYLQAMLLAYLGCKQEAFLSLEHLLQKSKRLKTWIILAKIIQDSKDLEAAKQILSNNLYRLERFKPHQWEILKHLANAAARIGEYKEAKRLFKESLFLQGNSKNLITKEVMDLKGAKEALEDLRNLLEANEIQMFLVSGTFLGCVREHNFISYDKDIDVGIYKQDLQKAREVLQKSKNFKLNTLFKNYQGGVQIRHLNNTYIDVFAHYEERGRIYHDGDYVRWWNTPFKLAPYEFLGKQYLAPKNYTLYLKENYGEWKTPKDSAQYETFLTTPNMEITNKQWFICSLYNLLFEVFSMRNESKILERLRELGEKDFVQEYLEFKQGITTE
ncbi:tetratricopeptide repeat protein [Helicobacter ganmani]|uniref:tetratricopeptide repeat protein n=2 Tax=Helicobacter ganmani TaxID=60246 RepID=UPI003A86864C